MSCIVVGPLIPLKILQRNITKQNYIVENSDPESQTSYTGHAFLSHRSAGLSQRPENTPMLCLPQSYRSSCNYLGCISWFGLHVFDLKQIIGSLCARIWTWCWRNPRKMTQTQTVFLWSFPVFFRWVTFECKNREVLIQTAIKDIYKLRNIEKQHDCLICSTSRKNDYQVSRSHWKEQLKYG